MNNNLSAYLVASGMAPMPFQVEPFDPSKGELPEVRYQGPEPVPGPNPQKSPAFWGGLAPAPPFK